MRLLLIGPPGSGKGTQATFIAERYGVDHISSGDLLRRHVASGSAIGRAAAACIDRGDLVPDALVMDILRKPVEAASRRGGYILDGFPRTVAQAEAAYRVAEPLGASVRIALHLSVSREELTRRLLHRGTQTGRTDDTAEVIAHRLDVFAASTAPLLDYYAARETVISVDGEQPVEDVTRAIADELDRARRRLGIALPPQRDADDPRSAPASDAAPSAAR
ncbi:adenylate kinase [Actinoplanes sp. NPDC049681]|uniref:adenylate kinase n=1 Tax=Actinoplanes sp. NPDC049681 TaxID=3363905 RepID=UPI0037880BCD